MSQRHFGTPLLGAREDTGPGIVLGALAILAGVLVAEAIDPGVLGDDAWPAVVSLLVAPAATAVLFGGHAAIKLAREMRAAEAAGSVTVREPAAPPTRPGAGGRLVTMALFGAVALVVSLIGGAAACIAMSALLAARSAAPAVTGALVARDERRRGRRCYSTAGEPEKIVWPSASGLD